METRNYYVVLGVNPLESSIGIRSAFRELVHRYHPDRAGSQEIAVLSRTFVEAYRVLSNPTAGRPTTPACGTEASGASSRVRRSPRRLAAARAAACRRPSRSSVTSPSGAPASTRWPAGSAGASPIRTCPSHSGPSRFRLEVVLPPDRAARGGLLELAVPVFYPCRSCHGARAIGPFPCRRCGGRGMEEHEELVQLSVPARLRDGSVFALPLRGLGIHGLFLELMFRVGGLRD